MCVKVSDMVLPPITGLRITFGTYMEALGTMGREFNAPFPPILSNHAPNWLPGPVFETSHTLEEKHVRESLKHGVTTHITGLNITFGTYMEALGTMGR